MPLQDKPLAAQIDDVTLKSIDKSVVNWFERDFSLVIDGRKVPVIYATAERWAKVQKEKGFRDENGVLMLPLVSIRRTTPDSVKERYVPAADETNLTLVKRISTIPTSETEKQPAVVTNKVVDPDYLFTKDETVYEIVQLPFPSFLNLDYDITIWTSFMTHQNLNQENIYREFRGGRQYFKINDYYFFGMIRGGNDQSNLDDFSGAEKIIRYNFKLMIQAYLIDKNKIKTYRTSSNARVKMSEKSISR